MTLSALRASVTLPHDRITRSTWLGGRVKTGAIGSIVLAVAVSAGTALVFAQSPQSPPQQAGGGRGRGGGAPTPEPPGFTRIKVVSSVDQSEQDAIVIVPQSGDPSTPRPLAVFLHAWSVDYTQRQPVVEAEAEQRGWLVVIPNFRGPFNNPNSCGGPTAQQDVLDARRATARAPLLKRRHCHHLDRWRDD